MSHAIFPAIVQDVRALGVALAELRYDAIVVMLQSFQNSLRQQAEKDTERGRTQLGGLGKKVVGDIGEVIKDFEAMLHLSLPYLAEEFAHTPRVTVSSE